MKCPYCPQEIRSDDLLHVLHCDGQQGAVEAQRAARDDYDDGPMSTGGWDDPELNAGRDRGAHTRARRTDPETSHEAGAPDRARDRDRAYTALKRAADHGLTDFELADAIGRQQTSAGKRRGELRDEGLVIDSGLRRSAPSGSAAIVWRLKRLDEQ